MQLRQIPNILTTLRLILVVPILLALLKQEYAIALGLFIFAGFTDAIDGLLARVYGWTSEYGAMVDPLADKVLLTGSFIALWWTQEVSGWLVVLIIVRDVWIVSGAITYHYLIGRLEFAPTMVSKINTFLQIFLVVIILIDKSLVALPHWFKEITIDLILVTLVISSIQYTWQWGRKAIKNYPNRKQTSSNSFISHK